MIHDGVIHGETELKPGKQGSLGGKTKPNKRVKYILFFIILLVIGIVLGVFIGYRTVSNPQEMILNAVQDDATISIENVVQTSTKNGIKEWSLKAASADFMEQQKQAVFNDLSVTFFMRNGKTIHVSAEKGYLNTESRDIKVIGNVVADDGTVKFQTDRLRYTHEADVIFSDAPVKISGGAFQLLADTASYDLKTQITTFKGNVEGTIFENISM
jgi:lipopolysaccharide export system protein LptC